MKSNCENRILNGNPIDEPATYEHQQRRGGERRKEKEKEKEREKKGEKRERKEFVLIFFDYFRRRDRAERSEAHHGLEFQI